MFCVKLRKDERGICIGVFDIWNKKIPPEDGADKLKQTTKTTAVPFSSHTSVPTKSTALTLLRWDAISGIQQPNYLPRARVWGIQAALLWLETTQTWSRTRLQKEGRQTECARQLCTGTSVQVQESTLQSWRRWAWTQSNGRQMMPPLEWARCLRE